MNSFTIILDINAPILSFNKKQIIFKHLNVKKANTLYHVV